MCEERRQREMGADRRRRHDHDPQRAAPIRQRREPEQAAGEPKQQRRHDEVLGRHDIHRHQEGEAAQARAGEVREVDAAEDPVGLEEHGAEKESARQERQHVEHEISEQPPLLHRIGDQKDGVERNLLRNEIRRHRQRTEQQQRGRRHALPLAVEPVLADAHHRAGQAEAQHREADHERAEMGPAADLEDSHDANLQRDDRAGLQADRQVERGRGAQIEIEARRGGLGQAHRALGTASSSTWFFTGKSLEREASSNHRSAAARPDDDTLKYVVLGAGGADAFYGESLAIACRRGTATGLSAARRAGPIGWSSDALRRPLRVFVSRPRARAAVTDRRPWRSGI